MLQAKVLMADHSIISIAEQLKPETAVFAAWA
jgi:hypothetical protein